MSSAEKFERTEEEQKRCVEIHDTSRAELLKRQLSNSENYDKAILSLSSAALALSLTAIKYIVPLIDANHLWAIKTSWILFLVSIISSLAAFLVGNRAIDKQLSIEEDYYIKALVSAQTEKNKFSSINSILNKTTGIVFVLAISLVIFFVTININGDNNMSKKKSTETIKTAKVVVKKSAEIPQMQIAPGNDGNATASANVPTMQLAPGTKKPVKPAEGGNSASKDSSKK